jgi:hypothetical protein
MLSFELGELGSISLDCQRAVAVHTHCHPLSDLHSNSSGQILYLPFQRFQVF